MRPGPSKNLLNLPPLPQVVHVCPVHTHRDTALGCRARLDKAPCALVASILRQVLSHHQGTDFGKVISDHLQTLGWLEGLGVQAHSQFSSQEARPQGQRSGGGGGMSLFWACGLPPPNPAGSVPRLDTLLLLPSAWQCSARDFPAVTGWGILPNWSEWIAQRRNWKHQPGGVVGKAAPFKG